MKRKAPTMRPAGIDLGRCGLDGFGCGCPVELIHGCAREFLADFPFRVTEPVCSDPTHLRATRRSRRRHRREFTDADHVALLDPLRGLPAR